LHIEDQFMDRETVWRSQFPPLLDAVELAGPQLDGDGAVQGNDLGRSVGSISLGERLHVEERLLLIAVGHAGLGPGPSIRSILTLPRCLSCAFGGYDKTEAVFGSFGSEIA
jgi:hypothetical protein